MELTLEQINEIRKRACEGEQIPVEQLRLCIDSLRASRRSSGPAEKAAKPAAKKTKRLEGLDDLLSI